MKTIGEKAEKARDAGYKYIASVVKSHYNTTYYHVVDINKVIILNSWLPCPIGQCNNWHGRIGVSTLPDKTILRQDLFNQF